tara:strand:- start:4268 stop:4810 length:543 start_codon:yes stop_codon:yes gene_type:complete
MVVKEFNNILNKKEKSFLKGELISSVNFPFYLNHTSVDHLKDYFPFFSHKILHRPEDLLGERKRINSPYYDYFTNLFKNISKRCKFKYKKLLRICVNFTFNSGEEKCPIHVDHVYPHKQLLIYIHNDDLNSFTFIYNKDGKKLIKKIKPSVNKGVLWNGSPHYHITPKKGYRIVLIYTFK